MPSDLIEAVAEYLADIDSEPFAYEQQWNQWVGDIREESAR